MTPGGRPLKLAIVAGEESGDLLGADLVRALAARSGRPIELVGVGGRHLEALGLASLFDASQIALMGVTAVVKDLPRLVRRIGETARHIADAEPDCLITIDSPEFSLRVARKVRAMRPGIPAIHYVCPSVWAWRPGRAREMRPYIDQVLCLLPFEPEALQSLGGPPGRFVGHRLSRDPGVVGAAGAQRGRGVVGEGPKTLMLLPGSRRAEVKGLIEPFGQVADILRQRGHQFEMVLPTVPHVAELVREATAGWTVKPRITVDPEAKWQAFGTADAAIAASGTVSLELALARVPFVVCYKTDRIWRALMSMITVWSASLPNLIADWPVVPEYYNEYVRPAHLARHLEQLWAQTPARAAQLDGFEAVAAAMRTDAPSGELAAETVLRLVADRPAA